MVLKKYNFNIMKIDEVVQIPITTVLQKLGIEPVRTYKGGVEVAYCSPFRTEAQPKFFVNVQKNVWNDFAESVGGNVVDFVMRHQKTDFRGAVKFLEQFKNTADFNSKPIFPISDAIGQTNEAALILREIKPFGSNRLLANYITQKRGIAPVIAEHFLKEIHFKNQNEPKTWFAAGFQNRVGGFELRNPYFKGSIGGKGISHISGKNNRLVAVFEGFMDFLSYLTMRQQNAPGTDILVLNSSIYAIAAAAFVEEKQYEEMATWLHNDVAGKEALHVLIENTTCRVIPRNDVYLEFKDLNDQLTGNKKVQ